MLKLLINIAKAVFNWFLDLSKPRYETVWIEDLPENLIKEKIYIVGGEKYPFQAVFLCPKSCGKRMTLNISAQHNQWERWEITKHKNGTISLHPSIWMKTFDCNCHYWFKKGYIVWTK